MHFEEGTLLTEQSHSEPVCSFPIVGQNNESSCRTGNMVVMFLASKAASPLEDHNTSLDFESKTEMAIGKMK